MEFNINNWVVEKGIGEKETINICKIKKIKEKKGVDSKGVLMLIDECGEIKYVKSANYRLATEKEITESELRNMFIKKEKSDTKFKNRVI